MTEDREIIELLSSGDLTSEDKGVALLYSKYSRLVMSVLKDLGADEQDQLDVIQDVLVSIYQRFKSSPDYEIANLKYYLVGTAKNMWLGSLRKKSRLPFDELSDLSIADRPDEGLEEDVEINLIVETLNELRGPCKELLKAFYYDQKSNIDIAQMLGYNNANTVKSKKYKCLQRLKELVHKRLNDAD